MTRPRPPFLSPARRDVLVAMAILLPPVLFFSLLLFLFKLTLFFCFPLYALRKRFGSDGWATYQL